MPLSRNLALLASFEGEAGIPAAFSKDVAAINCLTGMFARRFVYSAKKDFLILKKDGEIGSS